MELEVIIPGVEAEIVGHECITVLFNKPWKSLSSAYFNSGFVKARSILNMHVPKNYDHKDPEGDIRRTIEKLGLPEPVIGMMTAVNIENVAVVNKEDEEGKLAVTAIVTAGISNAATVGERPRFPSLEGTINVILLVDGNFSIGGLVGSVMVATEAKTAALKELDIRSFSMDSTYALSTNLASGTTTDSVTISCTGKGEMINFNTTGIEEGRLIGFAVKEGILEGIKKQEKMILERPLLERLEERGISIDFLIQIADDHCFPLFFGRDRGYHNYEEELFKKELRNVLANNRRVSSLVIAGLGLEEDRKKRGLIPQEGEIFIQRGIDGGTYRDPAIVFGELIAEYIGGLRGLQLYKQSIKIVKLLEEHPFIEDITPKMYYILLGIVGGTMGRLDQKMFL